MYDLKEQEIEATAIINDEVKNEEGPRVPPLNNKVTQGLSNPFEGTSWG
jgi:hypothetical protein